MPGEGDHSMSMTSNVYEVLMYIFDHYMEEDNPLEMNQDLLANELAEVGFKKGEVRKAFAWLESLAIENHLTDAAPKHRQSVDSFRVFTEQENSKLPAESQGFLHYLDQVGVLDVDKREMIIDRALALETDKIDLEQLKWVALMVLFNQSDDEVDLGWIEDLVFNEPATCLH